MKGISSSRSHHHVVTCDPGSYDALGHGHHPDRKPYLINQMDMPMSHPSDHPYYGQVQSHIQQRNHTAFPSDSSVVPYGTFPRRHYSSSHHELKDRMGKDECPVVPYGVGVGVGNMVPNKGVNVRLPVNLLDQFERQPSFTRDGYHTLQYKRTALEQRNDSPGRIRHLVHSVQKLFAKSHSLEGPHTHSKQGSVNGSRNSPESETPPTQKYRKRSKSRERCKSAEPKQRSPTSGYWSSDDILDDRDVCHSLFHSPTGVMTMGRHPDKFQSQYFMEAYNTISEHALKTSRSNDDVVKHTCVPSHIPISMDAQLMKKSLWSSSLTVPQDEWSGFSPLGGKEDDIPCRRMRSGSYVKAMAEDEDSGDSEESPKLCPKIQAQGRRASYLKATQPSLTEMTTLKISTEHSPKLQIRSHSYLRAVSEVSINRSLDTLDPKGLLDPKALLSSPQYRSRNESYMRAMSTISQVSEVEVNGQIEQVCEQMFSEMESQAIDALDLPMPSCFRMRSHSYVRAMDQGCSEDEGTSLLPASPPMTTTTTTVRTIQSSTVSSCITTYKKTPPPVPPRTTTSKPFISITAQSSTESAQDAYMDGHGQGSRDSHPQGDMTIQSGLSNSTESIDSMKALTAAIDAANAQVHGPASQHVANSSITITTTTSALAQITEDSRKEQVRRAKCQLSIGIQVDGPEEEALEMEDQSKFQSIGVQAEDERGYRQFTRSNSVTAAVQADLDMPDMLDSPLDSPETDMPFSGSVSRKYSREAATSPASASTVSIQGSGNHYHACTSDDYDDVGFDPSILPPPDPWIDSVTEDPLEVVQRSVCQRDGRWFLKLLQAETDRMKGWCRQMEQDEQENDLPDDILGKMRLAVGSAQLLMSQRFQQFRELCEENLIWDQNPNARQRPISQDLAGFWDMLQLSIENISLKFDVLHQLRANNWKPLDPPERKERRIPPPVPKKPPKGHPPLARDRSLESSEKQRLDARKRLMAAKRAASVRQNSATERADSIEIYIPEAQTRL
ncbi:disks large-associated protein 1 isoform X3 [Coregonus clupeaformis]|uniref:disks large-associated protein 1 isoform X3 n=1 Tax=Coregonus clupeaformis TaxID=59861 RepID=UPI001BE08FE1|nr:disks large-associated protein 1 isoform X3 [Coregonus clupeaformis]